MQRLRELRRLGLANPLAAARALRNLARTVWDPTDADVQHGINHLVANALAEAGPERARALRAESPEIAVLYDEGYDPPLVAGELERLPEGSVGREYLRFIRENGIDPLGALLRLPETENLLQYQFKRAYKLHDVLHVILGCDASVLGEVQIVSYSLGQARSLEPRAPAMALGVLFLHLALRRPRELAAAVEIAAEWLRRGRQARPYATYRVEDWLAEPVETVRARVVAPA